MKKNLYFLLKYLGPNDETVSRGLEAPTSTSIKNVCVQIKKLISQFSDKDIILIHHNQILEDDQTLEQLSQQGDVIILILPKIISVNIFYGKENPKRIEMDITLPIKEIIEKYVKVQKISKKGNSILNYALAYEKKLYPELSEKELKKKKLKQKKKKSITKYQMCCLNLPLYAHKWWYSNFYLIRCLSQEDIFIKNEEERQFIIDQAQFSSSLGLCAYKIECWAELISYQIFFHKNETSSIKEMIEEYMPSQVDCSPKQIQAKIKEIGSDLLLAQNQYITKSITNGCQCSYIENVKMKWMRFWYKYKIYVSSMNVMIFSGNGKTFQYMKEINMIDNIQLHGTNIYSLFDENDCANIKNDIIQNTESPKNDNNILNNKNDSKTNVKNNDNLSNNNVDNEIANSFNSNESSENLFFFSSNNESTLGITIYFKDNTNWELCCDSQPSVSRLKFVLDYMISLYSQNESIFLEKVSTQSSNDNDDDGNDNNSNRNSSNNNTRRNNDALIEEEEMNELLNNIPGDRIGIFNPNESFNITNKSYLNLTTNSQNKITQYPHYSVVITPEEIENKVVFRGRDGYNRSNEFNFLKENIQRIKIFKSDNEIVEDSLLVNDNDPLLANFFAFGPNEKGNRNIIIIIIFLIIVFYCIHKYYFHK